MKRIFLLLAMVYLVASHGMGQDVYIQDQNSTDQETMAQFGLKIGTNYSNVYDEEGEDFNADPKFGLATGAFLSVALGRHLGVQPEILFSQKGYKASGTLLGQPYTITRITNYIDVPLLISIKPTEFISVLAGPQYSYLISQKNKFQTAQTTIEQEEEFENETIRKNTFCFTGGLDINFNPLVLSGRVGWDLFKNNGDGTTTTPRYKNVWYQLTLGYRI